MLRVLFFISKPQDWTADQFREYYETKHAPMMQQLPPEVQLVSNKRWFLDSSSPIVTGPAAQYDLVMEMGFRDEAHYKQLEKFILDDGPGSEIYEEKAKFQRMQMLTVMHVGRFEEA